MTTTTNRVHVRKNRGTGNDIEWGVFVNTRHVGIVERFKGGDDWVYVPDAFWGIGSSRPYAPTEARHGLGFANTRSDAVALLVEEYDRYLKARLELTEAQRGLDGTQGREALATIAQMAESIERMAQGQYPSGSWYAEREKAVPEFEVVERLALMADHLTGAAATLKSLALARRDEMVFNPLPPLPPALLD